MTSFIPTGLGWQRDLPDPRDYTVEKVSKLLAKLPAYDSKIPKNVDLRKDCDGEYFTHPKDQGSLNSSPAFACLAMVEYFERAMGRSFGGSPLFLYHMARDLSRSAGNSNIGIRTTLKALRRYGSPPEEMLPYKDEVPDKLLNDISLLGYSKELEGMVYFRLDTPGQIGTDKLLMLKSFLAAGFPVALGFPVPRSTNNDAEIPYRRTADSYLDSYRGGQSVLAIGYDEKRLPGNQGAILIRNSWGASWGEFGYGWLPYWYVSRGLATDLWTITGENWRKSKRMFAPPIQTP